METFWTVKALAAHLNVSVKLIYREIARGKLVAVRVGNAVRLRPEDVDDYLSGKKTPSPSQNYPKGGGGKPATKGKKGFSFIFFPPNGVGNG